MSYGPNEISIGNLGIERNGKAKFEFRTSEFGQIISYTFNDPKISMSAKNDLIFSLVDDQSNDIGFLEFIYVPEILSNASIRIIETYLSIKFGISLEQNESYVQQIGDTIWSAEENKLFSNRVTGIGRNVLPKFNQLQSTNSENVDISMAYYGERNNDRLDENHEYLLWGDNNGSLSFVASTNEMHEFTKRTWKTNIVKPVLGNSNDSTFFNVAIKKDVINIDPKDTVNLWLGIAEQEADFESMDVKKISFYQGIYLDSLHVEFTKISIEKSGYFKIFKLPRLKLTREVISSCNSTSEVNFEIDGGVAPYRVDFKNIDSNTNEQIIVENSTFTKGFKEFGNHEIIITDHNGNNVKSVMQIYNPSLHIDLPKTIQLPLGKSSLLTPVITTDEYSSVGDINFEWVFQDKVISNTKDLSVNETGYYQLNVKTKDCECRMPIEVTQSDKVHDESVLLLPNPINAGDAFALKFNLNDIQDVDIHIYDTSGKLIALETIPKIEDYEYRKKLNTSGTYLILVHFADTVTSFKLVVK